VWDHPLSGADGGKCLIDPTDASVVYAEFQDGYVEFSGDAGGSFTVTTPKQGTFAWVAPLAFDPSDHNTVYIAGESLYETTDQGVDWQAVSGQPIASGEPLQSFVIAPTDRSTMYGATITKAFRSTNGGVTWTNITAGTNATDSTTISSIAISPVDPKKIWLTLSGFGNRRHVYSSANGGNSWTNITGTLPNVPANTITAEGSSRDGVYLGTDLGVFYRDNTMSDWQPYTTGLPNVSVADLAIHASSGLLRAATFGRGLWEAPLWTSGFGSVASNANDWSASIAYPNPIDISRTHMLSIATHSAKGAFLARLSTITGKTVIEQRCLASEYTSTISLGLDRAITPGIYVLEMVPVDAVQASIYRQKIVIMER
jgi:hypothetical protein